MDLDAEELEATRQLNSTKKKRENYLNRKNIDRIKMQKKEDNKKLTKMKAELVKKEYQDNLQNHLDTRLTELREKLKQTETGSSFNDMQLRELISQKNLVGASPQYTTLELAVLFEYYKQFLIEINQIQTYRPSKENFCAFCGISTTQYDNWKISDDPERREAMQMIDDYLVDMLLTSAQEGNSREVTTIFRSKSRHGLVEAQAPVVIKHENHIDMDKIKEDIEAVNQGKRIEVEKKPDGSYGI